MDEQEFAKPRNYDIRDNESRGCYVNWQPQTKIQMEEAWDPKLERTEEGNAQN